MSRFTLKMNVFPSICLETPQMCVETLRTGLNFLRRWSLRGHMLRFPLKMNVFPSICLEAPLMCVDTLRKGLIFLRQSIWGVSCLGLLSKWMVFHLSPWKPHKCVLKPLEQGSIFWDDQFEGSHAEVYSQNECFSIYIIGNTINVCWNP